MARAPSPARWGWLCLAVCVAAGVGGCGFHLRGSGQQHLAIDGVFIEGGVSGQFTNDLRRSLAQAGATFADRRSAAKYILNLKDEQTNKNVLTVSQTGQVLEYELQYAVTFEVMDRTGRRLIAPQRVSAVRDVTFNASTALGKANEEQQLYTSLHRDAIRQIITGLRSKLSQ